MPPVLPRNSERKTHSFTLHLHMVFFLGHNFIPGSSARKGRYLAQIQLDLNFSKGELERFQQLSEIQPKKFLMMLENIQFLNRALLILVDSIFFLSENVFPFLKNYFSSRPHLQFNFFIQSFEAPRKCPYNLFFFQ